MKRRCSLTDVLILAVLLFMAAACLIPFLNTVAISFSDMTSASSGKVFLLPVRPTAGAYRWMLRDSRFFRAFGVSAARTVLGTAISVAVSVLLAYPLSKSPREFRGRSVYMWILVFTMMFNGGIVPTFLVIFRLGLLDTLWALVLPTAVNVFNTILLMNFCRSLPDALEETARVDGAGAWTILWKVIVPLSKPCIATIALFTAVTHWNAFLDGKIYIDSPEKVPLQTYLTIVGGNLISVSAQTVVTMLPLLALYPFLQKYFVTGIVMGAVKE